MLERNKISEVDTIITMIMMLLTDYLLNIIIIIIGEVLALDVLFSR